MGNGLSPAPPALFQWTPLQSLRKNWMKTWLEDSVATERHFGNGTTDSLPQPVQQWTPSWRVSLTATSLHLNLESTTSFQVNSSALLETTEVFSIWSQTSSTKGHASSSTRKMSITTNMFILRHFVNLSKLAIRFDGGNKQIFRRRKRQKR